MNDKQFQRALDKTTKKLNEYKSALSIAEEEYARAGILEELELHIRLNEDDWCRNPQKPT